MDKEMPVAVLQQGTTSRQKRAVGTLATIEEESKKQAIHTPAIIVVGKVCALAEQFFWYEKLPLFGKKILLTRPKETASRTAAMLREQGAEVLELPAIKTLPISPNEALSKAFVELQEKRGDKPGFCDWLLFTSPIGVRVFFEEFSREHDIRELFGSKIAAIGEGTRKALLEKGLKVNFMPSVYDGETLGKELASKLSGKETLLIPRAEIGGKELTDELGKVSGVTVYDIPTYKTEYALSKVIDERKAIEAGEIDLAVFTSASTVRGFKEAVGDLDFSSLKAICMGKQTLAEAEKLGMHCVMAKKPTIEALVEKVIEAAK